MRTASRLNIWFLFAMAAGIYLAWLLLVSADIDTRQWSIRLPVIMTSLAALAMSLRAWRSSVDEKIRQTWAWLTAAICLWTVSDITAFAVALIAPAQTRPFGAPELLSLSANCVLFAIPWIAPRGFPRRLGKLRLLLDVFITIAAIATLDWLLISPLLSFSTASILPVLDALLQLTMITWFLIIEPGKQTSLPGWLAFAVSAFLASDLVIARMSVLPQIELNPLTNLGWLIGDLILLLAAWLQSSPQGRPTLFRNPRAASHNAQSLMPFIALSILGWYILLVWQLRDQVPVFGLWMLIALTFAFLTRLSLIAGEVEFEQYARLVHSIAEPTFVCTQEGELVLVNPALLKITGNVEKTNLLGSSLQQLIRPSNRAGEIISEALSGAGDGEVSLLRYEGSWIPVFLSLRILSRPEERLALAGSAHDLTEIKRGQAALQQAYEQLASAHLQLEVLNEDLEQRVQEKTASLGEAYAQLEVQNLALQNLDRLKSDFVTLVSHDLRAPLTNINGGLELVLSRSSRLSGNTRQILSLVQTEITRLTRFIETILDISALDAGRMPLHPFPTAIAPLIEGLQRNVTHLIGSERIAWNIPAGLPLFIADSQALFSVLFHLVDNALKYAPEGAIEISAGVTGDQGWISVTDEGEGIPEQDLPLLFTRFFRSHSGDAQTVYGHGLGLYIVQRLLEAMDGKIEVSNRPIRGACFTCWLPIEANANTETDTPG